MGAPDELDGIVTPCPACGRLIQTSVQFKVGSCYLNHHRLGDKISWGNEGIIYSPEAKGKDRFDYPVAIMACPVCVGRYAWQYRAIRRELEAAGRLEFLDEPPAEAAKHPEPNQQDGFSLVDGIYPAWAWIRFELERLGAPVADSLETWEGTLVIKNDVLSEVLPAKEYSMPRKLSTTALLSDCLYEEMPLKPMSREIRPPQVALEELSERQRMLCRRIEHAPEYDYSFSQWMISNIQELAKLEKANVDSCTALAAHLNALGNVPGHCLRPDGVLVLRPAYNWAFGQAILRPG